MSVALNNYRNGLRAVAVVALLLVLAPAQAETKLELEATEITGARELPKVLYIVPWKNAAPDPRPLPMRSLVEDVLSPVDMDEFRRRVRYHQLLENHANEK
jgi:hypothetical protein